MTKITELINIETKLLSIKESHRFDISLNDNVRLERLLREIGEVTNIFFSLQVDYSTVCKDCDKLQSYHDKLMEENVDIDLTEAKDFLNTVKIND